MSRLAEAFNCKNTHSIRDTGPKADYIIHQQDKPIVSLKIKGAGCSPKYIPKDMVKCVLLQWNFPIDGRIKCMTLVLKKKLHLQRPGT